jgi:hypothetical protein
VNDSKSLNCGEPLLFRADPNECNSVAGHMRLPGVSHKNFLAVGQYETVGSGRFTMDDFFELLCCHLGLGSSASPAHWLSIVQWLGKDDIRDRDEKRAMHPPVVFIPASHDQRQS